MLGLKIVKIISYTAIVIAIFAIGVGYAKFGFSNVEYRRDCITAVSFMFILYLIPKTCEYIYMLIKKLSKSYHYIERYNDIANRYGNVYSKVETYTNELKGENEQLKAKIAESEAELATCREQLAEARMLADTSGNEQDIPYTLWREVLAMRKEGLTDEQIAVKLNDKGQGVSQSQLGCLLYTGNERLPSSKTLQNHGTRLFSRSRDSSGIVQG